MSPKSEEKAKKLVKVLAASTPMTGTGEEVAEFARAGKDRKKSEDKFLENLAQVSCICYSINFGIKSVLTLFNLGGKVNVVHPTFAK